MLPSKGKGNHGIEVSQDVIDFLTTIYSESHTLIEASIKANVSGHIIKRIIQTRRCSPATMERIQSVMQKQEVC
jgi:hypothetical protein